MSIRYPLQVSICRIHQIIIIDADGLRDYIIDYGHITSFNNPHQSPNDYVILGSENINDIYDDLQSQIIRLRFAGRYGTIQSYSLLDLSSYHFNNVQFIQIGCQAFFKCYSIQFKSNRIFVELLLLIIITI